MVRVSNNLVQSTPALFDRDWFFVWRLDSSPWTKTTQNNLNPIFRKKSKIWSPNRTLVTNWDDIDDVITVGKMEDSWLHLDYDF